MRGVDIGTRQEVYSLIRSEAAEGRCFLWYTTETDELLHCDHVYVFRAGAIVAELAGADVSEEKIIQLSFQEPALMAVARAASASPARSCCRLCRCLVLAAIAWLNPRAISYFGFNLMLSLALPIALATVAQMFVIAGSELDLSIGSFISFCGCVVATWLTSRRCWAWPYWRAALLYMPALGALIHLRNLPSIVVTLGMSFVWQGLAILVLPQPGRRRAGMASDLMSAQAALCAAAGDRPRFFCRWCAISFLMRTGYGAVLRGVGRQSRRGRPRRLVAAEGQDDSVRSGRLVRRAVGPGADWHRDLRRRQYRQRLHACFPSPGVILGGGEFVGGVVSPVGAVIGALTLTLAASPLLTFMHIPPDWQIGANGVILIIVLAARALIGPGGGRAMIAGSARPALDLVFRRRAGRLVGAAIADHCTARARRGMLTAALALAVFMVIAGIGQMFVITLGPGNIDLSLAANIGLASAVAMTVMNGSDAWSRLGSPPRWAAA